MGKTNWAKAKRYLVKIYELFSEDNNLFAETDNVGDANGLNSTVFKNFVSIMPLVMTYKNQVLIDYIRLRKGYYTRGNCGV